MNNTFETARRSASPLTVGQFRLFWLGQVFVQFGTQAFFVSLTWLVLTVTGSGVALGAVLMVAALPRATLMLVSGAISDRLPPRYLLAGAAALSALAVGSVAVLLAARWLDVMVLAGLAALNGLADAFYYPASLAAPPRLVRPEQLNSANAILQVGEQLTNVFGPAGAGWLIGALGLAPTLSLNAGLFALGAALLLWLKLAAPLAQRSQTEPLGRAIWNGLKYAWGDPVIRGSVLLIAMLNFALLGPIVVGGAALVEQRFGAEPTTYGNLMAAYGLGALIGLAVAARWGSALPVGPTLIMITAALGGAAAIVGLAWNVWVAGAMLALMGVGGGVLGVVAVTVLQLRTDPALMGRVMSVVMFAAVALDPASQALSGVMLEVSLTALWLGAGGLLIATALWAQWARLFAGERRSPTLAVDE